MAIEKMRKTTPSKMLKAALAKARKREDWKTVRRINLALANSRADRE